MAVEGQTAVNKRTGERAVFTNGQWVVAGGKAQPMEASMRSRTDIGLGPMVQAQQTMKEIEAQGNPFSLAKNPGNALAEVLTNIELPTWAGGGQPLGALAKRIGGDDFQAYDQARKTYEAQLMPIMSGAAVSPSEAQRQVRSALPQLGDSPANLGGKGVTREMMLNGAAKAKGLPLPYPNVPTYGVNSMNLPAGVPAPRAGDAEAPAKPKFKYLGTE